MLGVVESYKFSRKESTVEVMAFYSGTGTDADFTSVSGTRTGSLYKPLTSFQRTEIISNAIFSPSRNGLILDR